MCKLSIFSPSLIYSMPKFVIMRAMNIIIIITYFHCLCQRCGVKIFTNYAHKDLKFSCYFHHVYFLPLNSVKITCFILPHSQISERGLIVSLLLAAHDVKQRYGETEAALLYIFLWLKRIKFFFTVLTCKSMRFKIFYVLWEFCWI